MIQHSISCPFPEGCSCGASYQNMLEERNKYLSRKNEKLINEIRKIIKAPDYTNPELMVRHLKEILQ